MTDKMPYERLVATAIRTVGVGGLGCGVGGCPLLFWGGIILNQDLPAGNI